MIIAIIARDDDRNDDHGFRGGATMTTGLVGYAICSYGA
jgi:hypothetical protein